MIKGLKDKEWGAKGVTAKHYVLDWIIDPPADKL